MSVDAYDCDEAKCSTVTQRRARKEHKCCACRETIRRGDLYEVYSGIDDPGPFRYKRCLRCTAIAVEIMSRLGYDQYCQYDLNCGHDWREAFDGPPPNGVAALAFMTPDEAQALLKKN